MSIKTLDDHISIDPQICGGKPHISGHRITVQQIATWHERLGQSVDDIATEYDLSLSDVHAALAYYFDHREAIDRSLANSNAFIEELKARTPSLVKQKLAV